MDVPNFVRRIQHPIIEWVIRALTMWCLAQRHHSADELAQSRYMYSGVLRYLANLIGDPRWVVSDITLFATIASALFELLAGDESASWLSGPTAGNWVIHSRAVKHLIQTRGIHAHADGIGRTLLYVFRPFLVLDAFVHREPCVLDTTEWKALNRRVLLRDERRGRGGPLVVAIELAFEGIAACPRLLAHADTLLGQEHLNMEGKRMLSKDLQQRKAVFHDLERRLVSFANASLETPEAGGEDHSTRFHGHAPTIARLTIEGIHSGLDLLQHIEKSVTESGSLAKEVGAVWTVSSATNAKMIDDDFLDRLSLSMAPMALVRQPSHA
jgi:hypothetical protein